MAFAGFIFSETSPSAAGTAASSQPVSNSTTAGIAWPLDDWEGIDVIAEITGATGGTLDVYLQLRDNPAGDWYDAIHWTQALAGASLKIYKSPLSLATNTAAPVVVGKNTSPALAANTVVNGAFTDAARLVMVAGASTSAGAAVKVILVPQRVRTNPV